MTFFPAQYWKYCQEEGTLWTPEGALAGKGFSGHDSGVNNPAMQRQANIGPIPQGVWEISGMDQGPSFMGPVAIEITPLPETVTFGRNGFYLHGDTTEDVVEHTQHASHGCIVMPRATREAVLASPCKWLIVVVDEKTQP